MEIRQYFLLLTKWFWLILLGTTVAGVSAYLYSSRQAPVYRATAILLVSEGGTAADSFNAIRTGEMLASSYAERLTNYEVLAEVIDNLGLQMDPNRLRANIHVNLIRSTHLIALSVEHVDPNIASKLANEIPEVFAERNRQQQLARFADIKTSLESELAEVALELAAAEAKFQTALSQPVPNQRAIEQTNESILLLRSSYSRLQGSYEDVRLAETISINDLVIDEYARPPANPVRPNVVSNTVLAIVAGAMLAIGVIFLIEYLDDKVRDPDLIEQTTGLSVLGGIQVLEQSDLRRQLVAYDNPRAPAAEAFRQIRTNIKFFNVDHPLKTLLITSTGQAEGKTTIAANFAVTLAQANNKVILVDADLRRPALHKLLGIPVQGFDGLSDMVVSGDYDSDYIIQTDIPNLYFLPSGELPPNPAELLGSERMKQIVAWLEDQADYVIFDSPPLLAVTDAAIMSQLVDSSLYIVSTSQTRMPAFIAGVKQLAALDSHIIGVVLNKISRQAGQAYYYYYYTSDDYAQARPGWRSRLASFTQLFQ
jgi:capsular exopolysaccharide synthesis family protein